MCDTGEKASRRSPEVTDHLISANKILDDLGQMMQRLLIVRNEDSHEVAIHYLDNLMERIKSGVFDISTSPQEADRITQIQTQLQIEMKRADRLEAELKHKTHLLSLTDGSRDDAIRMYQRALEMGSQEQERAIKAETRENELKEVIDFAIRNDLLYYAPYAYDHFMEELSKLYPEESAE